MLLSEHGVAQMAALPERFRIERCRRRRGMTGRRSAPLPQAKFWIVLAEVGSRVDPGDVGTDNIAVRGGPRARSVAMIAVGVAVASMGSASAEATLPGRNGDIVFGHEGRGGTSQICILRSGARHVECLTSGRNDKFSPAYSPDGERIAFSVRRWVGSQLVDSIKVMEGDGSHVRFLAHGESPQFRPDGRKVVFTRVRGGGSAIYTLNPNGGRPGLLIHDGRTPTYSPDGRSVVYEGTTGGNIGLVKARADGSRPRQLTVSPVSAPDQDGNRQLLFIDSRPRFSPDGRRIVFLRSDAGQAGGVGDIYLMDANGNHVEQLTPHRRYANNYADPTFSPDGRMIAFADESSNGRSIMPQIYVMHPDGRGRRPATRSRGWFTGLDWQSLPPIDQGPWGTRR